MCHIPYEKYLQIRIRKFESFEIADEYQSLIGTCFTAVTINRSRTFARMPHDDCDIAVIYMKSTENEEQVTSVVSMLLH